MRLLLFISGFLMVLSFVRCSTPSRTLIDQDVVDGVRSGGPVQSFCEGDECCSEHKKCVRACNHIFSQSHSKVRKRCQVLPADTITYLEDLMLVLRTPLPEDLEKLDLDRELRLLLALDYQVWVRIIKNSYTVDQARGVLMWLANSKDMVEEFMLLKKESRNEIMYELLAAAGDPTKPGPVEEGLAQKISFNQSFLQLTVSRSNYGLLQITHDMIRDDLCGIDYGGESQTELCILRIYCKEKPNQDNQYVHSEDLRNEIVRNIEDEDFFNYIDKEVRRIHSNFKAGDDPIMNNQVCLIACNDGNRGCE